MPRKMRQSGVDWIGEIPEGWGMLPLKRCADCLDGKRIPIDVAQRVKGPYPYWGAGSIQDYVNNYIFDEELVLLGEDGAPFFDSTRPVAFRVREKIWVNNHIHVLKARPQIDSGFLVHWLNSVDYHDFIKGSILTKLTQGEMRTIPVLMPSLSEQRKIANHLDLRCGEVDGIIADTKASIEDYKVLKKTLVFDAVTGKNLKGKKVASGQDWLGDIPAAWDVRRIVNLYREVSERGDDSLPILSVSINTGVSDKELSDEEQERVFIRSEDKTKYKRVQPGDLTYNMMRAWQGAFGAVRVNGMVSPAYVVARPKVEMDSRYVEYLLRSPNATREMQRYSRGIADFRLRLYWPEFKNIRIPCPPLEEQRRIADMLDEKCGEIDAVIADKERLIADLETYKKSLIFEVVTGKREVA